MYIIYTPSRLPKIKGITTKILNKKYYKIDNGIYYYSKKNIEIMCVDVDIFKFTYLKIFIDLCLKYPELKMYVEINNL